MSRIGKKPISIPSGVDVKVDGQHVTVKGPLGQMEWTVQPELQLELKDGALHVLNPRPSKKSNSLWGMSRTYLSNMIQGVSKGFEKVLEVEGSGYRVDLKGKTLVMDLRFSHEVQYKVPEDLSVEVSQRPLRITIKGIDKQRVGQVAAEIRAIKKPEPYKGKGIRYLGEQVRRKAGKAAG